MYDPAEVTIEPGAAAVNEALPPVARGFLLGDAGYACLRTDDVELGVVRRILTHVRALARQIDAALVRLLAAVELDQTVIWFVSDHGDSFGRRRLLRKSPFMPCDGLARVPLFCAGAAVQVARRLSEPLQSADLALTLLEQAGIEPPPVDLDAVSPASVLRGEGADPQRTVYRSTIHEYPMARRGARKYFHHEPSGEEMRFDLGADPGETRNRIADSSLGPEAAVLRSTMPDQRLRGIPDLPRFDAQSG